MTDKGTPTCRDLVITRFPEKSLVTYSVVGLVARCRG